MNSKLLAIVLAALVVTVGGAAAVGSTIADEDASELDTRDAAIDATYDNGTVTATITNAGEPVDGATVEVGDEEYTTDANGTVTADVADDEDEVEVSFETDGIEGKSEYAIADGELVLQEEEFEYEAEGEEPEDDEAEDDEAEGEEDENEEAEDEDDEAEEAEDDEAEDDEAEGDEEDDETEEPDEDDEEPDDESDDGA